MVFAARAALAAAFVVAIASSSAAQLPAPQMQDGPRLAPVQPDSAFTTFDGMEVRVQLLVAAGDTMRLIMIVTEMTDPGRRVAFVQPQAVLIDDLGNEYRAVDANGIWICTANRRWDLDTSGCGSVPAGRESTVRLVPNLPVPVVLTFAPTDQIVPELATLASTATLTARVGIYSEDFRRRSGSDIIITGIELPR